MKNVFEEDKLTGDENFDLIDGWEELAEKYQEQVREALIQGHVQDDVWKGVSHNHPSAFTEPTFPPSTSFHHTLPLTVNIRTLSVTALASAGSVLQTSPLKKLFVFHKVRLFAKS